ENKIGSTKVVYSLGCTISSTDTSRYAEALNLAATSQYVIFVGGLDPSQEGEGFDRVGGSINLPGKQQDLINRLAAVNPNIIVVIKSGGICGLNACINNIKGLIYAFYPGQEGGNAIADVIFGDYNPAGRLPVTMPKTDSQLPTRDFDFNNDWGSGYRWFDKLDYIPQFAFGYGLSYTTFTYSNLIVSPGSALVGDKITVSANVTNTGSVAGEEVVQLYITDNVSSMQMPEKQLKGFKRIALQPGETKTVSFQLTSEEFYYFDEVSNSYKVEPGEFTIKVGGSSDNLPLIGNLILNDAPVKPDLRITWVKTIPAFPVVGDTVIFLAGVKNQGTGSSPLGTNHKIIFKVNDQIVAGSVDFSSSIATASLRTVESISSQPFIVTNLGEYNISAVIDPDNTIHECIEDNNNYSSTFKVGTLPPSNLALFSNVIVTSQEDTMYGGRKAVDGNKGTRWSSAFSDPQSIIVDLGSIKHFNKIVIYWEAAYGKDYHVQVSNDNSSWSLISSVQNGDGGIDVINKTVDARYVKVLGVHRATQYGYSIYELEVYNIEELGITPEDDLITISDYQLEQNYPNPFNPSTTIAYNLPLDSYVSLSIYDVLGQKVDNIINGFQQKGYHTKVFNAENLSAGIYIYKLEAKSSDGSKTFISNKKFVLLK
ncbi:MAG: glycoside hydrolase family 3 C-terminal domain-containing protein, partial [Syntrophothermus sp.]